MNRSILAPAARISFAVIVAAAVWGPGAAQAQQNAAARQAMEACRGDYQTLCPTVQPGGGRILICLQQHADKVSAPCKQALASMKR